MGTFEKQVIMVRGDSPLGMVRKRVSPHAETRGTVLLIHGFGQNRYTWHIVGRSFSNYLASEGFDVFNVDLRGHGRSRHFGGSKPELLDEYIRHDVPAAIEESLRLSGHDRAFLVGHSMGGLISYAVAGLHKKMIRGVSSVGSPVRFGRGSQVLRALTTAARAAEFTGIFDNNPRLPLRWVGQHFRRRRDVWDSRYFPSPIRAWKPGAIEEPILEKYLELAYDWTSLGIALEIVKMSTENRYTSFDGLIDYGSAFRIAGVPLLVIAGSEDTLAPPASVKPAFDDYSGSDKTYRVFPLGHVDLIIGREAPLTVWPTIRNWIVER